MRVGALAVGALLLATFVASAPAATSSSVVGATVPSSTSLVNGCSAAPATSFGLVSLGSLNVTDTGAGVCRLDFGSSNDTASLRIRQADRTGTAMASRNTTWTNSNPVRPALYDSGISPVTSNVRYVSGEQGTMLRTTDAGATWSVENAQTANTVRRLAVVDDDTAYAVGGWCFFACPLVRKRTSGGGSTWATQSIPGTITGNINGIDYLPATPTTLVTVGQGGEIMRTTNGGAAWTELASPTANGLTSIRFRDSGLAIAVGAAGTILRSTDSGATWSLLGGSPTGDDLTGIAFTDATTAWVVSNTGVWRSTDALAATPTWTAMTNPFGAGSVISDIDAVSTTNLWLSAWSGIAVTNDADQPVPAWTYTGTPITAWANSMDALSTTDATVAAWGGTIFRSTTGANLNVQRFEAPQVNGMDTIGTDVVLGVGDYGYINRTANAGSTWTTPSSGTTQNLRDVTFVSDSTAIAVGFSGTMLRSTDAGATWASMSPGFAGNPNLYSIDHGHGVLVVVGNAGFVARSLDDGASWTTGTSGTAQRLRSVAVADDDGTAWAAGEAGTILRSTDAGSTWSDQSIGGDDLYGVAAPGSDVAWVSGANGSIHRTTDGGATWPATTSPNPAALYYDIDAIDANRAVAVGGSALQRSSTTDGGGTWTTSTGYFNATSVRMVDAATSYVGFYSGGVQKQGPVATVPDYNLGTTDWGSTGGTFGGCLQDAGLAATPTWTEDITGIAGQCEPANTDPWNDVPTASEELARTTVAGATGRADLVWGLRPAGSQAAGSYVASVEFEVLAPG